MDNRTETELHRTNELFLDMLAHMARHDATPPYELLKHIYRPLNLLDATSRYRAGQRPYLLIDCRFQDEVWWEGSKAPPTRGRPEAWESHFPRRMAVDLTRRTLTLAWHTALGTHAPPPCARLGLSPAVADVLMTLPLSELERIAERHVNILRPRWEGRPAIWRRLLDAARDEDTKAFQGIDLQAAQLLANDLRAVMV